MKHAPVIKGQTVENPDMAQVAQLMRVMAASTAETETLTFLMRPGLARKIAHHLDGGGFHAAREAEQAAAAAQAQIERQVEAEDRLAWVKNCQRMLDSARRDNRRAQMTLVLALLMFLGAPLWVFGA